MHDCPSPKITFNESSPDNLDTCQCYALRALNPKNGPEPDQFFPSNFTAALLAPLEFVRSSDHSYRFTRIELKATAIHCFADFAARPTVSEILALPQCESVFQDELLFLSIPFFSFPFPFPLAAPP